jgi:hypothetical protein
MMLLMVLCVGLLSLSSISLRGASNGQAMATARANARLALQLAIGDLQKSLGPDRAVTASSELLAGESVQSGLTGVWESWDCDPRQDAPDYDSEKSARFRRWLVSAANPADVSKRDFATKAVADEAIPLVSATKHDAEIRGGRVPTGDGAFAWHVSDESVKARIDVARDPSRNQTLAERRALVAGHRNGIRTLTTAEGVDLGFLPDDATGEDFQKAAAIHPALADIGQTDLLADSRIASELHHDLTTCSLGVLADVRTGGLKRDLTSAFEASGGLPAELAGKKLYQSTHGASGVSDPYWSALAGYYNTYKKVGGNGSLPSFKLGSADPVQIDRPVVPRNYSVAPVIAKFEVLFTFVVRDTHSQWVAEVPKKSGDAQKKYMMHMVYLPLVTLHNPYNAELEFDRLTLLVRDIPAAFNFYVNGKPQNSRLVPFNEMFITNAEGAAGEKAYMLDLANWQNANEATPGKTLKMKPGQTLVCGPYMDPASTSVNHLRGATGTKDGFASGVNTTAIKLRPGFAGKAVGLSVDWLTPPAFNAGQSTDGGLGVLGLRLDDQIRIESGVRRPMRGVQDHWEVEATLVMKNKKVPYGGMLFQYDDEATLLKHFDKTYNYPMSGNLLASSLYEQYGKTLASQTRSRAVASFSAAARTCNGGVYETNLREKQAGALNELRDGRLAGKPFLHHNPARAAIRVNLKKDLPGRYTHELNWQPLKGEVDDVLEIDALNRGAAMTGNTTMKGIKSGALFDLPSGPMQTLAGFRRSNALSSTYLPDFVQPLANSKVSPLMATISARQEGVAEYVLLDHSYLANHALYDGHYFSTIAKQGERGAETVFADFVARREPLATQCFEPWSPAGADPEQTAGRLFQNGGATAGAWRETAAWQTVKGAFNVNSTRVLAWKAMLASLAGTDIPVLWAKSFGMEPRPGGKAPVIAMTLPIGGLATDANIDPLKIDDRRTNEWNGYRSLDDAQLDELARRIVEEVKARGPFLSMSEFVNRRLGPESELTRSGALQAAIDKSEVNREVFKEMVPVGEMDVADAAVYGYRTPAAATGNPAEGAPGWITQGDLLHLLEPRATVRSDSFVVRTCGLAIDSDGKVIAKAYAEAVVQRVPDFIDSTNSAATASSDLTESNRRFGRRFQVVSFRWLAPREI